MPFIDSVAGIIARTILVGRVALFGAAVLVATEHAFAAEPPCPAAMPMRLDLPVTRAAIAHDTAITVVALGSSSTQGAGASAPDRAYPARLESLLRRNWPDVHMTVENKGIGGQTIDDVLPRLDADVVAARPTLIIWQIGTNEALRGMDPAKFDAMLDEGLRRLGGIGSDVILMDYQVAPRMPPEATTEVYGAIIAREAQKHGVPLFSRAAQMRAWLAADPNANDMIGADGLHHSDRGYACLASSLDSAILSGVVPRVATASAKLK
jgi:acyl-CoA thioesterase-1